MSDNKPKYPSMRDNPQFADAYTQRDGKKFFDLNKAHALAKTLFAKDENSSAGKALWGRYMWSFNKYKSYKQSKGEWVERN